MDSLDRLFDQVVHALTQRGPESVRQPVQVAELYQELVPYRQFRTALRVDTHQDYEMVMLRLLAGERGYARLEPPEAQETLATEAQAAYPEPARFREFAAARVYLNTAAAQTVLAGSEVYAPPPPPGSEPVPAAAPFPPPPRGEGTREAGAATASREAAQPCPYCGQKPPADREVYYCPFCGGNLKGVRCPECGTALEVGWGYCITCGRKMSRE